MATEEQPPTWFVSHAWSTPFTQTCAMLNFHMKSHDLAASTPYWVCTFANNQHQLGGQRFTFGGPGKVFHVRLNWRTPDLGATGFDVCDPEVQSFAYCKTLQFFGVTVPCGISFGPQVGMQ